MYSLCPLCLYTVFYGGEEIGGVLLCLVPVLLEILGSMFLCVYRSFVCFLCWLPFCWYCIMINATLLYILSALGNYSV
jgi:hypothetical protein